MSNFSSIASSVLLISLRDLVVTNFVFMSLACLYKNNTQNLHYRINFLKKKTRFTF